MSACSSAPLRDAITTSIDAGMVTVTIITTGNRDRGPKERALGRAFQDQRALAAGTEEEGVDVCLTDVLEVWVKLDDGAVVSDSRDVLLILWLLLLLLLFV
jgi:hypothetical protein